MNVVLTAERHQYIAFFKLKSSHVNLSLLTALSDKRWRSMIGQITCQSSCVLLSSNEKLCCHSISCLWV